uniref:Uncharacterized protein n=1 Tax=Trichogramma kaykai TaxID=54128 RepID=A0ABD2VVS2_9HYME
MNKSRVEKVAAVCTAISFIFLLIAFTTPNWLETDGKLEKPKFEQLGLWQICFKEFQDVRHWYDYEYRGCSWIFKEDSKIIYETTLPTFFRATQFFFTLCITFQLCGILLAILCSCYSRQQKKYNILMWCIGISFTVAATCGIVSVIIFGAKGDGRDWMPNWEHNDVGWSYALAVVGSFILLAGGVLFLIEARRFAKKKEKFLNDDSQFHSKS